MSSCAEFEVIFQATEFGFDALEVTLATFGGLILGIIIALVCSKCFFRELAKERIQKGEEGLELEHVRYEPLYPNRKPKKTQKLDVESESKPKGKLRKPASSASMALGETDTIESYDADRPNQGDDTFICALVQPTLEKTQIELNLQDFRCTHILEEELAKERSSVFLLLLQILLGKFVAKEKLDGEYADKFVKETTQSINEAEASLTVEHQATVEELKKDSSLTKDPIVLQEAIEKTWPEYQRKMAGVVQNAQVELRDDLSKESGLSDEEIDALVTKLMENMATAEAMIGQESVRQSLLLQERLAKRQALSEQYKSLGQREQKGNVFRVQDLKESAKSLCESKDLNEAQMQSILKQYEEDLARVQENHRAEVLRNSQQLAEKLQEHRQRRLHQLERKQLEEKEKLMDAAIKAVNPGDFVEAHHDLLEQQRTERNDLIDELDYHEAEELSTMRKQLEETRIESVEQQEDSYFETLKGQAKLDKKEASKMLRKHAANVKEFEDILHKQKQKQHADLQERIETRKSQWEKEWQKAQVEQKQLTEQQEMTVAKLLESQAALDEEAKEKIMLQHEQDKRVLNNHLQMTRLRHQKIVEAKLAKRRAKIAMLKEKQDIELVAKGDVDEKELEELEKEHEEQQKMVEQDIAEEESKAMLELRKVLAEETDIAIKGQDTRLSTVIAKLQVGKARRQAIIRQQDKALKELQDQMVDTVADSKTLSERRTEKIMEQHFEQLAEIRTKIADARDQQAEVLQQKLENMKHKRKQSLIAQLEEEKKDKPPSQAGSKKAKKSALGILNKILEDNRHKQEMDKMEQEMKLELAKQKEEMNSKLEEAMEKELQEHEKNFLGQLAAVSKLSKQELNEMIQTAVEEGGGDERTAKKMSKDLTERIKSARAQPEFYEEESEESEDRSEDEEQTKKKKRKNKRMIANDDD